jgi:hypothetical protein
MIINIYQGSHLIAQAANPNSREAWANAVQFVDQRAVALGEADSGTITFNPIGYARGEFWAVASPESAECGE